MAARTVTEVVTTTIVTTGTPSSTLRAVPQGGILEGSNPSHYDPKNPIIMFIIQAGIVLVFCRILHWPLSKLRQPRVIAEVIGGILLGPSVMGRIPGFTDAIFPSASMPNFTLVANLGLILFLFIVGLEVDLRFLASNWRVALSVGAAGMALPFGLGCAISWGLYNEFRGDEGTVTIGFGTYMLFIAIAMAITAFPVLCRILTELKLLSTPVGIIVLSAGVGNDVIGWILLALCVALVNAADGLTALWVVLTAVCYTLFLVFPVRKAFLWFLRKTRSLEDGPTQMVIAITLLIALTSAFFTGVIGIHPIFGAFMAGLICPHRGNFAIKVTEKVEDLVSILFLPLYFALSGLSTNLGLLNNGITWAYVFGVIACAFFGKFVGGSVAARLNGLVWRESFTIGALMSCKGLVELIVLNIGLQAKILSTRTFTIFVVMALVTTFATTPLTSLLYPPHIQQKLDLCKRGLMDWKTGQRLEREDDSAQDSLAAEKAEAANVHRVLMYLRLDSMPGLMALAALFGGANQSTFDREKENTAKQPADNQKAVAGIARKAAIEVHSVRLLELTERDSSVMKVSELEEYSAYDPVINTFSTFGRLNNVTISGEVNVVPEVAFAETLVLRAANDPSDLLLLPWTETGSMSESLTVLTDDTKKKLASASYAQFVTQTLQTTSCNMAIFINNGFGGETTCGPPRLSRSFSGISWRSRPDTAATQMTRFRYQIFLAYMGSSDDRVAMRLVLQLARDPRTDVTIVHFKANETSTDELELSLVASQGSIRSGKGAAASAAEEAIPLKERQVRFINQMKSSLSPEVADRIKFSDEECKDVKEAVLAKVLSVLGTPSQNAGNLVVVGRNAPEKCGSCVGVVGDRLVEAEIPASLLVLHAGRQRTQRE